ncbi:hypothetical protein BT96DRAFT_1082018 [Gymnopus androsaceus JB14]|uniref:F-box domain-containing protein n=1 Tax=Gymnopus androsaceus JB14 TaxID=1447944 RepID=A0A6A4I1Z7_9AGAR|nr:hypothetical protein BT96DRAFT_1082018 [Gymnopus androsaceus JB14]
MTILHELPVETFEEILAHCDPLEVAAVSRCDRFCYELINNAPDQHLWRALYLAQPFDDPTRCVSQNGKPRVEQFDWKSELQAIIRARTILKDASICKSHERTQISTDKLSQNLRWVSHLTAGGVFLDLHGLESEEEEETRLRAKIHTLVGLTPADYNLSSRLAAKGYVYNMRHYNWGNEFGPFLPSNTEGSGVAEVNWVHMKHIHRIIAMHLGEMANDTPLSYPYTQAIIPEGMKLDEVEDWAGINGTWLASFCFLNHQVLLSEPDKSVLARPDSEDVMRTIQLTVQVTHVKADPKHPGRPKIYFVGVIADPSTATLNGHVRMTDDDEIRWSFVSGEQGEVVWSCEGVQVGGVRSTTIYHEDDDPIGPVWLRKLPQDAAPPSST